MVLKLLDSDEGFLSTSQHGRWLYGGITCDREKSLDKDRNHRDSGVELALVINSILARTYWGPPRALEGGPV